MCLLQPVLELRGHGRRARRAAAMCPASSIDDVMRARDAGGELLLQRPRADAVLGAGEDERRDARSSASDGRLSGRVAWAASWRRSPRGPTACAIASTRLQASRRARWPRRTRCATVAELAVAHRRPGLQLRVVGRPRARVQQREPGHALAAPGARPPARRSPRASARRARTARARRRARSPPCPAIVSSRSMRAEAQCGVLGQRGRDRRPTATRRRACPGSSTSGSRPRAAAARARDGARERGVDQVGGHEARLHARRAPLGDRVRRPSWPGRPRARGGDHAVDRRVELRVGRSPERHREVGGADQHAETPGTARIASARCDGLAVLDLHDHAGLRRRPPQMVVRATRPRSGPRAWRARARAARAAGSARRRRPPRRRRRRARAGRRRRSRRRRARRGSRPAARTRTSAGRPAASAARRCSSSAKPPPGPCSVSSTTKSKPAWPGGLDLRGARHLRDQRRERLAGAPGAPRASRRARDRLVAQDLLQHLELVEQRPLLGDPALLDAVLRDPPDAPPGGRSAAP